MKRGKGEKLFTIHTYVVQLNICVNYSCISLYMQCYMGQNAYAKHMKHLNIINN